MNDNVLYVKDGHAVGYEWEEYRPATDSEIISAYYKIIKKRDAERSKVTSMWKSINMEEDCAEMPDWESEDDSDHN